MADKFQIEQYLSSKGLERTQDRAHKEHILKKCPFCSDIKFHFFINQEVGLYHCKKCGAKGNFYQFKKMFGDIDEISRPSSGFSPKGVEITQLVSSLHKKLLENEPAQQYLQARGISIESIKEFKLGYENNWIVIPHYINHEPVSIKYRQINPKQYRRLPNTPSILFNTDNLDSTLSYVIITEGEFDTIKGFQDGIKNIIGTTTGAESFQQHWLPLLEKFEKVYICFDSDVAGQRGAQKVAEVVGLNKCFNVILPDKDLNDFLLTRTLRDFEEILSTSRRFEIAEITSMANSIDNLNEWLKNKDEVQGLKTGFRDLDDVLKGLKNEDLIIVSGSSTVGKTSMILNFTNSLLKEGKSVLAFLLEGRLFYFIERLITIDANSVISDITETELTARKEECKKHKMYFYTGSQGLLTIEKVVEKSKACKEIYDVDLIIIDHLHKIVPRGAQNYSALVGKVVSDLKNLAVDLKIPVIAIAHIRKLPSVSSLPTMQDLRDSSFIHQDPDVILMLWSELDNRVKRDNTILKVLKNRTGLDGIDLFFKFNRETGKFIPLQDESNVA